MYWSFTSVSAGIYAGTSIWCSSCSLIHLVRAVVGPGNTRSQPKQIKPMQIKQVAGSLDNDAFAEQRLQPRVWCETPESMCLLSFLKGCRRRLRLGGACFGKNTFHCLYQRNFWAYVLIETQLNHIYRDGCVGWSRRGGCVCLFPCEDQTDFLHCHFKILSCVWSERTGGEFLQPTEDRACDQTLPCPSIVSMFWKPGAIRSLSSREIQVGCCNCAVDLSVGLFVSVWKAHCLCRVHLGRSRSPPTVRLRAPRELRCSLWLLNLFIPLLPCLLMSLNLLCLLYSSSY